MNYLIVLIYSLFTVSCGVIYEKPRNTRAERARYFLDQLNDRNERKRLLEEKLNDKFRQKVMLEINAKLSPMFLVKPINIQPRFVNNPLDLDSTQLENIVDQALDSSRDTIEQSLQLVNDLSLDEDIEQSYLQGIFLNENDKPQANSVRSCVYKSYLRPGFSLLPDYEYCLQSQFSRLEYWYYKYRMEGIYLSTAIRLSYFSKLESLYNSADTQRCLKETPSKSCIKIFKSKLVKLKLSHFSDEAKLER